MLHAIKIGNTVIIRYIINIIRVSILLNPLGHINFSWYPRGLAVSFQFLCAVADSAGRNVMYIYTCRLM